MKYLDKHDLKTLSCQESLTTLVDFMKACNLTSVGISQEANPECTLPEGVVKLVPRFTMLEYSQSNSGVDPSNIAYFVDAINANLREHMEHALLSSQVKNPVGKKKQDIDAFLRSLDSSSPVILGLNKLIDASDIAAAFDKSEAFHFDVSLSELVSMLDFIKETVRLRVKEAI